MIYVDPLFDTARSHSWPYTSACHMGTDDRSPAGIAELHRFAARIGLRIAWYQDKPYHKHYDLTPYKRGLAIKAGAIPVNQREYVLKCSDNPIILAMGREDGGPKSFGRSTQATLFDPM